MTSPDRILGYGAAVMVPVYSFLGFEKAFVARAKT